MNAYVHGIYAFAFISKSLRLRSRSRSERERRTHAFERERGQLAFVLYARMCVAFEFYMHHRWWRVVFCGRTHHVASLSILYDYQFQTSPTRHVGK